MQVEKKREGMEEKREREASSRDISIVFANVITGRIQDVRLGLLRRMYCAYSARLSLPFLSLLFPSLSSLPSLPSSSFLLLISSPVFWPLQPS